MRSVPVRLTVLILIFAASVAGFGIFALSFPERFPERTLVIAEKLTALAERVTLPIKLAQLALEEPDATLRMPVHGLTVSRVTDTWGAARSQGRSHEGQDLFAPKGTPVFSATEGYVRRIGTNELGGNIVFVTGKGGRRYYYAHLDSWAQGLTEGQWVTTDTVLGFVGNTGNAITTPPHLHFGMYVNREAQNPFPLLRDRVALNG